MKDLKNKLALKESLDMNWNTNTFLLLPGCMIKGRLVIGWSRAFFWVLYSSALLMPHNIDIIYFEKNVFNNIFYIMMNVKRKTKDTNTWKYIEFNIQKKLHLIPSGDNKYLISKAPLTLAKDEIIHICEWLRLGKLPYDFTSNIANCVRTDDGNNLTRMKSHDCQLHTLHFKVLNLPSLVWALCSVVGLVPLLWDWIGARRSDYPIVSLAGS